VWSALDGGGRYLSFVKDTNLITTDIGDPNSKEEAV
jgi:hypothetical protein